MARAFRHFGFVFLMMTSPFLGRVQTEAPQIAIRFNPPHGTQFEENLEQTNEYFSSEGHKVERMHSKTKLAIRKTGSGYTVIQRAGKRSGFSASSDVMGLVNSLAAEAELYYDLDDSGKLIRVRGYQPVMRRVLAAMDRELRRAAKKEGIPWDASRSAEELVRKILTPFGGDFSKLLAAQWNAKQTLGLFVGETVQLGRIYHTQANQAMPWGGTVVMSSATKFTGPIDCGSEKCVSAIRVYEYAPGAVGEGLTALVRGMLGNALDYFGRGDLLPDQLGYRNVSVKGDFSRDLDPTTGLPYFGKTTLDMTLDLVTPDGNESVRYKRTSIFRYRYR